MQRIDVNLELIDPLFLGGGITGTPELRAAPFRGQMRYWYRAVLGRSISNTQDLFTQESKIFGSTQAGSVVALQVSDYRDAPLAINPSTDMLPHRTDPNGRSPQPAYNAGGIFRLTASTRTHAPMPPEFHKAFLPWIYLGGIGKRSRRGFGSLQIEDHDSRQIPAEIRPLYQVPNSPAGMVDHIQMLLQKMLDLHALPSKLTDFPAAFIHGSPAPAFPSFKTGNWVTLVCHLNAGTTHQDQKALMVDFWLNCLRKNGVRDDRAFGFAIPSRFASPFHFHIYKTIQSGEAPAYSLVLTAFNTNPRPADNTPQKIADLFKACQSRYGGIFFTE